jgi:hypothetical protein
MILNEWMRDPVKKDFSGDITRADYSPSGRRALLVATRDIFTVPAKKAGKDLTASTGHVIKMQSGRPTVNGSHSFLLLLRDYETLCHEN